MVVTEPSMIGLSKETHPKLQALKEERHFDEMLDAYRMAIALAVACNAQPEELSSSQTIYAVSSVDQDRVIHSAVRAVYGEELDGQSVYRFIERLADWGVRELHALSRNGRLDLSDMLIR